MSKQVSKKNLLIVCEGTVTEPFYFRILADNAIEKGEWDNVEIIPKPRNITDDKEGKTNKKPKRAFKNTEIEVPESTILKADDTEKKYLKGNSETYPTPLRFVKEARDRLAEGAYDEAWVVFDRDGHPAHEAAFALASETDKPVRIAFSSRSFEQWVLLYFEQSLKPFDATECKIRQKSKNIPLDCMSDKPLDGSCVGDKCLNGYIRGNYLPNYSKKGNTSIHSVFQKLSKTENISNAIVNAAWLRAQQRNILRGHDNRVYMLNPYTTVDVLVKRLLGITENVEWVVLGESVNLQNFDLVFELEDTGHLRIHFTNKGRTTFTLNAANFRGKLYCIDAANVRYNLNLEETFTLLPNQAGSCLFALPDDKGLLIHLKIEDYLLFLPV